MAIIHEKQLQAKSLEDIAGLMIIAARTAPKGRGRDNIYTAMITGEHIEMLAQKMREIGELNDTSFFLRDAANLESARVVVLLGARISTAGLKQCGYCGHTECSEKEKFPEVPCAFNTVDLGIALGSAVAVAADHRADNRIMFSIGKAALALKLLPEDTHIIFGIPLSATAKNPFFDRK